MKHPKLHFTLSYETPDDWNEVVQKHNGFLVHTTYWADIYTKSRTGKGRYLRGFHDDKMVLQLLVIESLLGGFILIDYVPESVLLLLTKIPYFTTFTFHMGPVFLRNDHSEEEKTRYFTELILYLSHVAKKERRNIGPGTLMAFSDISSAKKVQKNVSHVIPSKIVATVRSEIKNSEEQMFSIIEYSRRKNIKRAERLGVNVTENSIDKMGYYWNNLKESWKDYGLSVTSLKYYKLFPANYTKLFFGYDQENLIGGNGVLMFGKTCIEFSIFISNYEKTAKTRGGDLIKWNLIKDCIKNGITYWDLNMIDLGESEEKTKKINFYKLEWNGDIVYGIELFQLNTYMSLMQKLKHTMIGK